VLTGLSFVISVDAHDGYSTVDCHLGFAFSDQHFSAA
jgi:hypothetical protein